MTRLSSSIVHGLQIVISSATLQAQLANAQEEMLAGDTGRTASALRDARTQV